MTKRIPLANAAFVGWLERIITDQPNAVRRDAYLVGRRRGDPRRRRSKPRPASK